MEIESKCPEGMKEWNIIRALAGDKITSASGTEVKNFHFLGDDHYYPYLVTVGERKTLQVSAWGYFKGAQGDDRLYLVDESVSTCPEGVEPFDLQRALEGEELVTRHGVKTTLKAVDISWTTNKLCFRVGETTLYYPSDGKFDKSCGESCLDLFMAKPEEKKETVTVAVWARVRPSGFMDIKHIEDNSTPVWKNAIDYDSPPPSEPIGIYIKDVE